MNYERRKGGFAVSTDPGRLDVAAVHDFLTQAYWSVGIPRDLVERALANSQCFGLYAAEGQVGLARVISDRATFAYLCDVYVLPEWRGRGLGRWLMECVLDHPELAGLRRFILVTRDAHELYRPFGFGEPARPEVYMEIAPPNPYLKQG